MSILQQYLDAAGGQTPRDLQKLIPFSFKKDWRINPTGVKDSGGQASHILSTMTAGKGSPWLAIPAAITRTIEFDIPEMGNAMLAFEYNANNNIVHTLTYSESFDGGLYWSPPEAISVIQPTTFGNMRLGKHNIKAGPARKVRFTSAHNKTVALPGDNGIRYIANISFFEFEPNDLHDYVVFIGASVPEIAVRHHRWSALWREHFGRDPVVFNEAVGGWESSNFAQNMAAIVARHPRARHFVFEFGGNDVSATRPYTNVDYSNKDSRNANLVLAIETLAATGKNVILSRMPYRNYTAAPAVNGTTNEENGAKPYLEAWFDRLIAKYSPQSHDGIRGLIDPYQWGRDNVHLIDLTLDPTGVHYYWYGAERLGKYWALSVGGLIHRGRPLDIPDENSATGVPGAKEHVLINFGANKASTSVQDAAVVGQLDQPEGVTWNQVLATSTSTEDYISLVNTEGERCTIGIDVTTAFAGAGGNGSLNAIDQATFPYLKRAVFNSVFIATGSTAAFSLTGLSNDATYKIRLFGSRDNGNTGAGRKTDYSVGCAVKELETADNVSNYVEWTGVTPVGNKIDVTVTADLTTAAPFGYLNALEIIRE